MEAIEQYVQSRGQLNVEVDHVPTELETPTVVVAPPADPAPKSFDVVGMADLIESGVKIQLGQLESRIHDDVVKNAETLEAIQRDVNALTSVVNALVATVSEMAKATLRQEVKPDPDPNVMQAQNLGFTLMNAKGAEVRFTIGDFKG